MGRVVGGDGGPLLLEPGTPHLVLPSPFDVGGGVVFGVTQGGCRLVAQLRGTSRGCGSAAAVPVVVGVG